DSGATRSCLVETAHRRMAGHHDPLTNQIVWLLPDNCRRNLGSLLVAADKEMGIGHRGASHIPARIKWIEPLRYLKLLYPGLMFAQINVDPTHPHPRKPQVRIDLHGLTHEEACTFD